MRVIVVKTPEDMGRVAADLISEEMKTKPKLVLGLATGSTPLPLYRELIRRHKEEGLDFSRASSFNLDEYVALPPTHKQSYRYFMDENLFNHININKKNTHLPDGMAGDIEAHCARYEKMIARAGGIDCQVLGIGANGHIGFNEPGSSLDSLTRIKTLDEGTVKDNSRFFEKIEDVPTQAITMGIGTILKAKKILLLATGKNKTDALAKSVEGPLTAFVPASALQLHRFATCVISEDAAGELKLEHERA